MDYNFRDIEKKWQEWWKENKIYKVYNDSPKPKYYVLDMFPYPSGAGLHVGHPLGYIASDIYARYKRLKGFNVLHPMGYDAFGLPAEQYAIEHGIHPAVSTEANIKNFRSQLDKIGFCYDWDREVNTSKPEYYKWTQWLFLKLYNSYFDTNEKKAKPITELENQFMVHGSLPSTINHEPFTAAEWKNFDEKKKQDILMHYRLAYSAYGEVNWCEALGTVLANDEVVNGVSERGGHPVEKRKMRQWYLRITAYADRLLEGLNKVDFSDAMKEMQTNWIGKSSGAEIEFKVVSRESLVGSQEPSATHSPLTTHHSLRVYTTRPDTIFGADFMVIAPELDLVNQIKSAEQAAAVDEYLAYVKSRSERERMAEKKISGVFTGAYAINPFDGREIPIWTSEYVLAGYGTGAIMAVPCGDERDHKFAKHFNIPITNIIGHHYNGEEANATKDAILENSGFLNGMLMKDAIEVVINKIEEMDIGKRKVNYKMRDAGFSRQRYWGEPFPIVWDNGTPVPLKEEELPLLLPHMDEVKPGKGGEGPLSNLTEWVLIPNPSPQVEKGAAKVPKYSVHTPVQYELARQMRKEHTEAEGLLWEILRNSKLGAKFRRQHPIDKYIVDFVSLQDRLIVEADGEYHNTKEQQFYDAERTRVLNEIGFEVMRLPNKEIIESPYKTGEKIRKKIEQKKAESQGLSPLHEVERGQGVRETSTMPGYAGSSWYFLRYMDPQNDQEFCSRSASDYWGQVDLYIGGTEHAVGHLLYSRMWTKVLYDLGLVGHDEPYKRLVNQGMITGISQFTYRYQPKGNSESLHFTDKVPFTDIYLSNLIETTSGAKVFKGVGEGKVFEWYISSDAIPESESENVVGLRVPIQYAENSILDISQLQSKVEKYKRAAFLTKEAIYIEGKWRSKKDPTTFVEPETFRTNAVGEKMSKSKLNTVSPYEPQEQDEKGNIIKEEDGLVVKYGADTFRMYEMFLGPVEMSKPWDTKGIEGVHRFLKKLWRLFFKETKAPPSEGFGEAVWTEEKATDAELKVLHKTIKKIEDDTERFSFNTGVSTFMICVNELTDLKCHKKEILEPLLILLAPYAPHIAEELWHELGNNGSILDAAFPKLEEKYIKEISKAYPVAINGKTRSELTIALDATQQQVEEIVLKDATVQKWLEGKPPKKIIYVKNKMINVVV